MKRFLYKWLPIFCGCHCRDDRSFYYKGEKFPVCARCTGELIGMVFSIILIVSSNVLSLMWCVVLMLPLIIDGFSQQLTSYESNNLKRIVTGFFFGISLGLLIYKFTLHACVSGQNIARKYF